MANPPTAAKFLQILRDEGLTVHEVTRGGEPWSTHNRAGHGAWGPVNGVVIHHTVTSGTDATVKICWDGYSSLPGPLCHGVIDKKGEVWLVGYGRANHAGGGDPHVLDLVKAESYTSLHPAKGNSDGVDGNAHFYGFECVNLGNGKDPWPDAQLLAIEKVGAAICRYHKWGERSVIGHREWSSDKIDPVGFSMDSMRSRVKARLTAKPKPVAKYHTVIQGDTLWSIAREHGTTVAKLRTLNPKIKSDRIVPGDPVLGKVRYQ